ncbi:MAG: methionine adenosyltransferase [Methyloglobulus sp.]|nr:methionine adenosyltransferase [Methyloglobulus sp.]
MSTSNRNYLFTSESVSEGHPDKMADQISDAILDAFLTLDPNAKVACETVLADQFVLVAGEFKTADPAVFETVRANAEGIMRQVIRDIGYTSKEDGIDPDKCEIKIAFNQQSAHINQGVDLGYGKVGAGDQGLMFGYACDETPELIPLAISLAHKLVRKQAELRKSGALPWLRPDAKSQVSVRYVDGKPVAVEKVVLSTQHSPDISTEDLRDAVRKEIVEAVIPVELRSSNFEVLINPTGRFEIGGPNGDAGLTGRKIIVDTYGGSCPHGGGAFSGKDPTKVDRSAAYLARYIAKNIVAAGLATRCLVQLAYAIGVVQPVSLLVDTYGTGTIPDEDLEKLVREVFVLSPQGIIYALKLTQPIYKQTASYGHFGRTDIDLSWEKTDRAERLNLLVSAWLKIKSNTEKQIDRGVQLIAAVNLTLKDKDQYFGKEIPDFYLVEAVHSAYKEKNILPVDYESKYYSLCHNSNTKITTYEYQYPRIIVAGPPIITSAHIEPNLTKSQVFEKAVHIAMLHDRRTTAFWEPFDFISVEPARWRGINKKYPYIAVNGKIECVLFYPEKLTKEELIKVGEEIVATWGSSVENRYRVGIVLSETESVWPVSPTLTIEGEQIGTI